MVQCCSILLIILVEHAYQSHLFIVYQNTSRQFLLDALVMFYKTMNRRDQNAYSTRMFSKIEQRQTILFFQYNCIYFNSYYLTQIQNRNRIAREDKHQKQYRYTRNIVEMKQKQTRQRMMYGKSQERVTIEWKQTRNRKDVLEIQQK